MLTEIVRHTPPWVWLLLAALVALGLAQTRRRRVPLARLVVLPAVLLLWGAWSLRAAFAVQPLVALAWIGAAAAGAAAMQRRPLPAGARWDTASRTWDLPGSWLPLALILFVFSLRYLGAVGLAVDPGWFTRAAVQLPLAAALGLLGGVFAGRTLRLLRRRGDGGGAGAVV